MLVIDRIDHGFPHEDNLLASGLLLVQMDTIYISVDLVH